MNFPILMFVPTVLVLWLAASFGAILRQRRPLQEGERDDFGIVQGAALTLLALLIGFTFSMATTRYDLRKNYEEAEANAIGTEYVRAGLLPHDVAARVQSQLKRYTELRIAFYKTRGGDELRRINDDTAQLQTEMWNAVQDAALAQPTPLMALAAAGMNDVLNSRGTRRLPGGTVSPGPLGCSCALPPSVAMSWWATVRTPTVAEAPC